LENGVTYGQSCKVLLSDRYAEWRKWKSEFTIIDESLLFMGKVYRPVKDLDKERFVVEVKREDVCDIFEECNGV